MELKTIPLRICPVHDSIIPQIPDSTCQIVYDEIEAQSSEAV